MAIDQLDSIVHQLMDYARRQGEMARGSRALVAMPAIESQLRGDLRAAVQQLQKDDPRITTKLRDVLKSSADRTIEREADVDTASDARSSGRNRIIATLSNASISRRLARRLQSESPEDPEATHPERMPNLDETARAAAMGDRGALTTVLGEIQDTILRFCRAVVDDQGREFSSDDVANAALVSVGRSLPQYRIEDQSFISFAVGIAEHTVADVTNGTRQIERNAPVEIPLDLLPATKTEQIASDVEATRRMRKLLGALPELQREILVLRLVVGLSAEETAAAVGSTPGAVRVAQHRALDRLKIELSKANDIDERRA